MVKFIPTPPRYDDVYYEGLAALDRLANPGPDPESLTCFRCESRDKCKFVDDWYNTDGDCLMTK